MNYILIAVLMICLFLGILISVYFHPELFLLPYNKLISSLTPKIVFYTDHEKYLIFPQSKILEYNWIDIKKEAQQVYLLNKKNVGSHFQSRPNSFWEGWTTFPLRMFNVDIIENQSKCPVLTSILKQCPNVPTAFFSVMHENKYLPPHYGPFKGILRYHLGLMIPNGSDNEKAECYISVDNNKYYWKEGHGVLFDETYKHYVFNNTNQKRVILFLDVIRPLPSKILSKINDLLLLGIKYSPHNRKALHS